MTVKYVGQDVLGKTNRILASGKGELRRRHPPTGHVPISRSSGVRMRTLVSERFGPPQRMRCLL